MTTNKDRANRARAALLAHQLEDCHGSKVQAYAELAGAPVDVLRYLLADLRHWCDVQGIAFHEADTKAHQTYTAEVVEGRKAAQAIKAADLTWEKVQKEADAYYAKHPEVKARVNANFNRWWGKVKQLPPCECGLDDVTPKTCPFHKALAKGL